MTGATPIGRATISVGALVPYALDTTPSQRFRIEQWRPYLKGQGIDVDLVPFASAELMALLRQPGRAVAKAAALSAAFLRRAASVGRASRYDVLFIHRALCVAGPALLERALNLTGRPLIFDFDDAIYLLHTSRANRRFGWLKFPGKTAVICRLSTHVVVGNEYLAEYARRSNPNVTVIPTSIDTNRYRPADRPAANGKVVVGWTGSATSQTYLESFAPLLAAIVAGGGVELRVVSNRRPELDGVPLVWRPWSPETEVEEIGQFDIGIMPMPDEPWALGKCALKALQYMAAGIPPVCSSVGANREVIQHGQNGLLATSEAEWLACVRMLSDDPALRRRIGAAARRTVEERYSMERCAEQFAQVVRGTLGRA